MKSRYKDTLLIVGDEHSDRANLQSIFESSYYLLEAENAAQGILLLEQNAQYIAAVLADIPLTKADDLRALVEACNPDSKNEIPVISVITPSGTGENEEYAFVLGVADVVLKPYTKLSILRRVQMLVDLYLHQWHLEKLVENQSDTIRAANQTMLDTLSSIIEHRSTESGNHVLRIRRFTKILLEAIAGSYPEYELDATTIDIITSAAALHDIGKISIPDHILNKPGKLTPEEFEIMKSHTTIGGELVQELKGLGDTNYLRYIYNIARYHHERWDGRGYPEGLVGDQIPICAQVVGLTDAFDALTTERVYKPAYPYDSAVNMILNGECGTFSPKLLECFKRTREQMVELAHKYADGYSPKADDIRMPLPGPAPKTFPLDAMQLSQLKYQALLHYLDDTVIEMDLDNRIYHVVYNPHPDFISSLSNTPFDLLSARIIGEGIHPEDAQEVATKYGEGMVRLFRQNMRKFSFRCRMYSPPHEDYRPYEIIFQRINTDNPNQRIMIAIFHNMEDDAELSVVQPQKSLLENAAMYDLTNATLCCLCDEGLTIREGGSTLTPLTGFTQEELWRNFGSALLELVIPEDREKVLACLHGQNVRSGRMECEFRIQRKNDTPVWVQCRSRVHIGSDGMEYCYCVLTDISRLKQIQIDHEQMLRRNAVIAEQSESILFEWSLKTGELSCSEKWEKRFGYKLSGKDFLKLINEANHFHPDDLPQLREKVRAILEGKTTDVMDIRIANNEGRYLWNRIRATMLEDEDGKPAYVVGIVYDIDELKKDAITMRQQAQRDELTKLLNKASTQRAISDYLLTREENTLAVLLLLDLDNFKTVNDSLGHMYGDAVLTQVGMTLRNLFRSQDVVGRVGGDEFMILLKDMPNMDVVQDRCKLLVETLRSQLGRLMPELPVSVSVGAAIAPKHGTAFTDLYRHADEALYTAKRKGKNQYKIYTAMDKYDSMMDPASRATAIDSDSAAVMNDDALMRFAFRSLYESRDIEATINELLSLIGVRFNVSRVYIFENNEENTHCSNTFEWCNLGISPEKENLQNISYETDIPGWPEIYDGNGMLYCTDITQLAPQVRAVVEPQGIKSMLHCAIMDQGVFRGYVGFDECTANCLWTPGQVSALQFLAEMLAVFLIKQRTLDRLKEKTKQ